MRKSYISFRDTTPDAPTWERYRSPDLDWWRALTEGFKRCRFYVEKEDRSLEEILSWFSQAMEPTMAALYRVGDEQWIKEVVQAGSQPWKAHHRQLVACKGPRTKGKL